MVHGFGFRVLAGFGLGLRVWRCLLKHLDAGLREAPGGEARVDRLACRGSGFWFLVSGFWFLVSGFWFRV